MQRNTLRYRPKFEGPVKGWAINHINKNLWRVESYLTYDDLLQDAFEYFLICKNKYQTKNAKHFMSLFQRCFINHFHDLAKKRGAVNQIPEIDQAEPDYFSDLVLEEFIHGPQVIKELALLLTDPVTPSNTGRDTTNEYWCRLLGIDPQVDIRSMVKSYFGAYN